MLKKLLEGNIQIVDTVENWEESIKIASQPLLEKKCIENSYVEAMINSIKELGPYIVLMPGVAMPHSRPEKGVNETSFSLLLVKEGVSYSEKKDLVKIVIILAAKDNEAHIEALTSLSELLEDEGKIEGIFNSSTIENIKKYL